MISVIIAVYERQEVLRLVFESLLLQTEKEFEIVVADDGSSSAIAAVVSEYSPQFTNPIRHIWHPDDGFRKTIIANRAVAEATGDYLIFIDGDVLLHHRFVEVHKRYAKRGRSLAGRRVMFDDILTRRVTLETVRSGLFEKPAFWKNNTDRKSHSRGVYIPGSFLIGNLRNKTYDILGSNFSLHKDDFIAVNGYDEQIIGRGMEDNNLWSRLKLNGIKGYSVVRLALQYHLFHSFAPVPHSGEQAQRYLYPTEIQAQSGISKYL